MSLAFEELAYEQTPIGELILRRRRTPSMGDLDIYEVILGDAFLMSSLFTKVEEELAHLGLNALGDDPGTLDVVVGGLGLGFTAQAALSHDSVASLLVVDVMAPVISWHRQGLVPLGAELCADPRCRLVEGDFFAMAGDPEGGFDPDVPGRRFHAVLLDIDHSPTKVLDPQNAALYTPEGLGKLAQHLHPGGVFGMWSDDPEDEAFVSTLRTTFTSVEAHTVAFENPIQGGESASTVYLARKE